MLTRLVWINRMLAMIGFDHILIAEHVRGSESGVDAYGVGLHSINTSIIVWMYGIGLRKFFHTIIHHIGRA